jgi:hypothetical protein
MKVKVDDLAKTVEQRLSDYADDVNDIVKQEIKDAGKEAVKELKEKSPKRTGKYAKGWRSTVQKETAVGAEVVVHNKIYGTDTPLGERPCQAWRRKGCGHPAHRSGRRRDHREAVRMRLRRN